MGLTSEFCGQFPLTLSLPSSLSYINQSIDLQSNSTVQFLYDRDPGHGKVKSKKLRGVF